MLPYWPGNPPDQPKKSNQWEYETLPKGKYSPAQAIASFSHDHFTTMISRKILKYLELPENDEENMPLLTVLEETLILSGM